MKKTFLPVSKNRTRMASFYTAEEAEKDDFFDKLPDPIVFLIFNKVHDAKSLCRSMSVCKRFHSIIPEVDNVFLSMRGEHRQNKQSKQKPATETFHEGKKSFKNIFTKAIAKPFKYFTRLPKLRLESCDSSDEYSLLMPKEALKSFRAIRNLELNLPNPTSDSSLNSMIWKAEFGSKLDYILALHAKEISEIDESYELRGFNKNSDGEDSGESSMFMKDEELDRMLTMTLACLLVASARRLLFHETLKDHQTLQNVKITDEKQTGTFSMNREQIEEFKRSMNSGDWIMKTLVESDKSMPVFRMNVWDVPELKLSGCTMKGVNLVMIERIEEGNKKVEESWDWVVEAFDGEGEKEKVFNEAVRKMFEKKRSYISREMNSSFDILQQ